MTDWKQLLRTSILPGWAILPLRLFLGVSFVWASFDKLLDPGFLNPSATSYVGNQLGVGAGDSPLGGFLSAVAVPNAGLFGALVMAGELLIGLAVLLGWFTRFSAVMGLLINLVFYLTITWDVRPFYYGADIVFVFAWLTLALTGPGPLSMDEYLRRWVRRPVIPVRGATRVAPARSQAVPRPAGAPVRPGQGPAPAGMARSGPPLRPGQVPSAGQGVARSGPSPVRPAQPPGALSQTPGRSSQVAVAPDVETVTRRQFNVLALSGLAAVVLGLLDLGVYPLLHRGDTGRVATRPGAGNPAGGSAPPTAGPPTATTAPQAAAPAPPTATAAANPPAPPNPGAPAPAAPDTPVPPPAATDTPVPAQAPSGTLIASPGQVPVGQAINFTDPSSGYPCVLVHLDSGYSAYVAICTHENCDVGYYSSQRLLACPCHGSIFDPSKQGAVVRGPARRPLQNLPVTVGPDGGVYLVG